MSGEIVIAGLVLAVSTSGMMFAYYKGRIDGLADGERIAARYITAAEGRLKEVRDELADDINNLRSQVLP